MGTAHSSNLCPDELVVTQVFEAAKYFSGQDKNP
jgi:hypothetical protein